MDAIKAWKDVDYRDSLSDDEMTAVPTHPGGLVSLDLGDLSVFAGGTLTTSACINITVYVCTQRTACGTCAIATICC